MSEPPVVASDHGAVRVLTLNRPHVKNAIDIPLRVLLGELLEAAGADPSVRAIVITGAGGAFCSGGDISTMGRLTRAETIPRTQSAARVIRAIWGTPKPVIAAVEGPAFGAGAALAMACDRVITSSEAIFSTSFTAVAIAGDMGVFASLPARVGQVRAKQLMMFPRRISGAEATELGIADVVVEPGAALETALADATQVAAGPAIALGFIKSMLAGHPRHPLEVLEREVENQAVIMASNDFAEAVAAFGEKRRPVFTDEF
jgi:enoyl-CoA hydratase/carnithine racemase